MRSRKAVIAMLVGVLCACAAHSSDVKPETWRARLRAAMQQPVDSREGRDELSRLLVDAVENAEIERLTLAEVRAAFGAGIACEDSALCKQHGFAADDWYYPIGNAKDPHIKQLPTLIIGWDPQGRAARVYALRTH
ncbi:MAG TPA: hypothetical protein VF331_15290 [Polyangiales bacterium]